MRAQLDTASSGSLCALVAAIDVIVWFGALPFEIFSHKFSTTPHPNVPFLVFILVVNAGILGAMWTSVLAGLVLLRRGTNRGALWAFIPALARALSRRPG